MGTVMELLRRIRATQDDYLIEWMAPTSGSRIDLSVGDLVDGMIMCSYDARTTAWKGCRQRLGRPSGSVRGHPGRLSTAQQEDVKAAGCCPKGRRGRRAGLPLRHGAPAQPQMVRGGRREGEPCLRVPPGGRPFPPYQSPTYPPGMCPGTMCASGLKSRWLWTGVWISPSGPPHPGANRS